MTGNVDDEGKMETFHCSAKLRRTFGSGVMKNAMSTFSNAFVWTFKMLYTHQLGDSLRRIRLCLDKTILVIHTKEYRTITSVCFVGFKTMKSFT